MAQRYAISFTATEGSIPQPHLTAHDSGSVVLVVDHLAAIADNNAQWEKATREELPFSNAQFADFIGRVKSHLATPAPTLREEIEDVLVKHSRLFTARAEVAAEIMSRIEKHKERQ